MMMMVVVLAAVVVSRLGQMVTKDQDQVEEMKGRFGQGWSAFCKLDNIVRDKNVQ